MRQKIIFFVNNDEIFTFPIVNYLVKKFQDKYEIHIKLKKTSYRKKIKILLILLLENSIKHLFEHYRNKIEIKKILLNNVKIVEQYDEKKFIFGISINYPEKIKYENLNIYNFHFGNFSQQRGTFIFFYNFLFNWKSVDLTFHKINERFDAGEILNRRSINIKDMKAIDLIYLPFKNIDFYVDSFQKIKNNPTIIKSELGKICREPSFYKIISTFIKK